MTQQLYSYFSQISHHVDEAISLIRQLNSRQCFDVDFLEHELIPALGLNNEALNEQPAELSDCFGKGLHLWQYPSQLSRYLVWLSHNAGYIKKYMEIGCRWGGTFILVSEWLQKIGAPLQQVIAVDPIEPTPFIRRYQEISEVPVIYINKLSTSSDFVEFSRQAGADMVFIDGDHSMKGVMFDHLLVRNKANIIIHHDIRSVSCPDTGLFWNYLKQAETDYDAFEFTNQYKSVGGSFLGIGVLRRINH